MNSTIPESARRALLNTVTRPAAVKANLDRNSVETAARLLRLAIARSGKQQKELGDDKGRVSRQLDGVEKLWFHEMVATWPPEVWCELLIVLAREVCAGRFQVKRSVTLEEVAS